MIDLARMREAMRTGDQWVRTGLITGKEAHPDHGYLWDVELVPDGKELQCELVVFGAGNGRGVYVAPNVGDEVLVVLPQADEMRAMAFGALNARPAPKPTSWVADDVLVLHPGGTRIQKGDPATTEAVLLAERFQTDLSALVDALEIFAGAMAAAATGPLAPMAAPATALQTALQTALLTARLTAAAYSSQALKAE